MSALPAGTGGCSALTTPPRPEAFRFTAGNAKTKYWLILTEARAHDARASLSTIAVLTGSGVFLFSGRIGAGMGFDYTAERWKRKRAAILRRDGYRCAWCKRYGRAVPAKIVHHLKEADEYPELAYTDSNLVSLCQACHNKAHPEKARAATAGRLR